MTLTKWFVLLIHFASDYAHLFYFPWSGIWWICENEKTSHVKMVKLWKFPTINRAKCSLVESTLIKNIYSENSLALVLLLRLLCLYTWKAKIDSYFYYGLLLLYYLLPYCFPCDSTNTDNYLQPYFFVSLFHSPGNFALLYIYTHALCWLSMFGWTPTQKLTNNALKIPGPFWLDKPNVFPGALSLSDPMYAFFKNHYRWTFWSSVDNWQKSRLISTFTMNNAQQKKLFSP